MKVSLNHIRFYKDKYQWSDDPAPDGIAALVERIGARLGAVEEVNPVADRYRDAVLVRVVSCERHPQADRLHVCKVDDGGKAQGVERDENGHVQVVCGAPNVHADMLAVWLPPGATVPDTFYDIDLFKLDTREIRGQKSNGMLASPKELGISDSHEGILEIDEEVDPGTSFVDAFSLQDDHVIDMENKMFTHRPDCFGMMGVAREIAGIQGQKFTSPDWYRHDIPFETDDGPLRVEVRNELTELVPRFVAVPMNDVSVKASPVWLQLALTKLGIRPINNIVDLTNYYMILTGQPLHAYDYDKIIAKDQGADHATISVRRPHEGEKVMVLGGKEVTPHPDAIMIATDQQPIGIGGVIGGADTEVGKDAKNIILECANFDMNSIRRTAMEHGLFTEAVTRFTKGQSPLQNIAVMARLVSDIERLAGGKLAGKLVDNNHLPEDVLARGSLHEPIEVTQSFINERLGLKLSAEEMKTLLTNVEFDVTLEADMFTVKAPFWRTDIKIPEDIVEEIGRLYGYDHLPLELPSRSIYPAPKDSMLELKNHVRYTLGSAGANEILTYNFVHGDLLDKVGQNRDQAFSLSNALSPDLQYYRLSLTPSLLEKVHPNIKAGHDQFALFELGKAHVKGFEDEEGLPKEFNRVALVFAAENKAATAYAGAPYYQARKYLINLLADLGAAFEVSFEPLSGDESDAATAYYAPGRAATVKINGNVVGRIGEYRADVRRALKLPKFCAGFELGLELLLAAGQPQPYVALPRFPKVEQDICLKVSSDLPYAELFKFVWDNLDQQRPEQTYHSLGPVDIYQRNEDQDYKQVTLRLSIASYERTLTDKEVNNLLDSVAENAKGRFGAERV